MSELAAAPPPKLHRVLAWCGWDAGLAAARAQGKPIVCLAEESWTTSAQRLALVLECDPALKDALQHQAVPVWLEPSRRPDLTARLQWAAPALGSPGVPLLLLLSPDGGPLAAYPSLQFEGDAEHPSLASLTRAFAHLAAERAEDLAAEASGFEARARRQAVEKPAFAFPPVAALWGELEQGTANPTDLAAQLDALLKGGIFDQLGGSFHRAARDARWIVPHFEKLAPQNAALAALYARAARALGERRYLEAARSAASFAFRCLEEGVYAVAADSHYYTWTSQEVQSRFEPELIQALGLHFKLTPHPSRHVLFRALELPEMVAQSFEAPEVLAERLERGKRLMRLYREQRPAPAPLPLHTPRARAELVRWLLEANAYGLELSRGRLLEHLDALIAAPFDAGRGYLRDEEGWLEDQAAVAAACLSAHRLGGEARWLEAAERICHVIVSGYCTSTGALSDRPASEEPSRAVSDAPTFSAVATALAALAGLADVGAAAGYLEAARGIAKRHESDARAIGPHAAGFWRAARKLEGVG